ncbi:MAG: hypothetical protein AAF318_17400 [Pseudomonadota bacterium]
MADLGTADRAALLILAGRGGTLTGAEFTRDHAMAFRKPQRDTLTNAGLITAAREGRTYRMSLTEAGWQTLPTLAKDAPTGRGVGSLGKALYCLLNALAEREVDLGATLKGAAPAFALVAPAAAASTEDEIRAAYARLADRPLAWVPLKDLRAALPAVAPADFHATVKAMHRANTAALTLEENQSRLTKADRDAAVKLGPDPMHYLSIEG